MKSKVQSNIRESISSLATLVKMQLRETVSLPSKSNVKAMLLRLTLYVLGIAVISALHYLILTILSSLGVLGSGGYLPVPIWNILFFALLIMNFLACINKVTDALYFSSDNQILLCFPVSSDLVFLSKIIVFFFNELIRNCFTLLPLLIGFGIANSFPIFYYPWLIVVLVFLSLLPVAIASFLSIPYLYIRAFLKRYAWVSSILALAVLIALTVGIFKLMDLLPEDLEITTKWAVEYFPTINNAAKTVQTVLYPFVYLTTFAIGYVPSGTDNPKLLTVFVPQTPLIFLGIILIIVVFFVFAILLAKPLYFRMASKTFEFAKPRIKHHFKRDKTWMSKLPQTYYVPSKPLSNSLMRSILDRFAFKHVDVKEQGTVIETLNSLTTKATFTIVNSSPADSSNCFALVSEEGIQRLALIERNDSRGALLYCPHHFKAKNVVKPSFFSFLYKEILVNLRSYQTVASDYFLFIISPIAILVLNSIFESMKKSFAGQMYTIIFNALIISCIILASNVSAASIYSREGRANYQLRSSPINYMRTLTSKLIIRATIVTGSLIFTLCIYRDRCSLTYVRMDLLFFAFYFLYLGHLLWSAELDYMHPKVELYAETGGQGGINSNEAISSALVFILSFAFSGLLYFFVGESVAKGFYRILIVAALFFLARLLLFIHKIRAYGMSTYEGRGEK